LDGRDIKAWADAFAIPAGNDRLARLYRKAALDDGRSPDFGAGADTLAKYEDRALAQARSATLATACQTYKMVGNVVEFFDAVTARDPALTRRNVIVGRVSMARSVAYG